MHLRQHRMCLRFGGINCAFVVYKLEGWSDLSDYPSSPKPLCHSHHTSARIRACRSQIVTLKPGREKAILNRHHWIFSGAIDNLPEFDDGDVLPVHASDGTLLGRAYSTASPASSGAC